MGATLTRRGPPARDLGTPVDLRCRSGIAYLRPGPRETRTICRYFSGRTGSRRVPETGAKLVRVRAVRETGKPGLHPRNRPCKVGQRAGTGQVIAQRSSAGPHSQLTTFSRSRWWASAWTLSGDASETLVLHERSRPSMLERLPRGRFSGGGLVSVCGCFLRTQQGVCDASAKVGFFPSWLTVVVGWVFWWQVFVCRWVSDFF